MSVQNLLAILFIASSVLASAQAKKTTTSAAKGYAVSGQLKGAEHAVIYLRQESYYKEENAADSALADKDGKFLFRGNVNEPDLYSITVKNKPFYIDFVLENSTIHITGNADSSAKATVTGSKEEEIRQKLESISLNEEQNKLGRLYNQAQAKGDTAAMRILAAQKQDLNQKRAEIFKQFIASYPAAFASVDRLTFFVNADRIAEAEELLQKFKQTPKRNTEHIKFFEKLIATRKELAVGTGAPVFTLKDTADNPVDFSSFRGSYVLLDFWASWCGPCRRENPNLVNLYKNYSRKNFTIVSVAINDDRQKWLRAIKKDNLLWTQLSDVEGRHNSVKEMYGVLGIPCNFLLDPSGKIIAKSLYGEELSKKLEEELSKL